MLSFQNVVTLHHTDKYDNDSLLWKLLIVHSYVVMYSACISVSTIVVFFLSFQNILPDKEILFDVLTFLWQKCKTGLQLIQINGIGNFKYNHKYKASKVLLYYNAFLLIQVSSAIVNPRKNTGLQTKCIFLSQNADKSHSLNCMYTLNKLCSHMPYPNLSLFPVK